MPSNVKKAKKKSVISNKALSSTDSALVKQVNAIMRFVELGQLQNAQILFSQIPPAFHQEDAVLHIKALIEAYSGNLAGSIPLFQSAIAKSKKPQYYHNLANSYLLLNQIELAFTHYKLAVKYGGHDDPLLHMNIGTCLYKMERYDETIASYQKALAKDTHNKNLHPILNGLGNAYVEKKEYQKAINCYEKILKKEPSFSAIYAGLSNAYLRNLQEEKAIEYCLKGLTLEPKDISVYNNLARALSLSEENTLACRMVLYYALSLDPSHASIIEAIEDIHYNKAHELLTTGNFAEGMHYYGMRPERERVIQAKYYPFVSFNFDINQFKNKTIFIHREQGLGDELFFLRFVSYAKAKLGFTLIYMAGLKISSILARTNFIDQLITTEEEAKNIQYDHAVLLGDFPHLCIPLLTNHYVKPLRLTLQAERLQNMYRLLQELGPPPYIALTWRGGTKHTSKITKRLLFKAIELEDFGRILTPLKGKATFISVQRLPDKKDIAKLSRYMGQKITDFEYLNNNLEDMLAFLMLIDDYIGVSNTNMHLMAGLGRYARVLVPYPPEWRWQEKGDESPWFKGFKVYRQDNEGQWGEALNTLQQDLLHLYGEHEE